MSFVNPENCIIRAPKITESPPKENTDELTSSHLNDSKTLESCSNTNKI